ncbi:MAG: phosphopantetheine-binding protein [Methylovirgula sp.]
MHVQNTALTPSITAIVRSFIEADTIPVAVDLSDLGLSSMDMVNLMLAIEAEFDLTVPGSMLIPDNFRTIEKIESLVRKLSLQ